MRYLVCCTFLLWQTLAYAQIDCSLSIQGRVVDAYSREDMCFANILINDSTLGAIANEDGYFQLDSLCPGRYTISCDHLGYDKLATTFDLRKDTVIDFYLNTNAAWLNGVTIEEHLDKVESSQAEIVLEGLKLDRSRAGTLGQTLSKLPGVYSLNTGNSISKPILHGMHSNRLLILNNGIRQEGQQWGQEHGPEIDPFVAKKITVIKGASGVKYGPDAIGGVILVDPAALIAPPGIRGDLYLRGNLNGRGGAASLMLEGSFNKLKALSWRVQGTFRKLGDLSAANYLLANTGVEEYNFSAGIGYHKEKFGAELYFSMFKTKLGILLSSHTGNLTDLNNAIGSDEPLVTREFSYSIDRPFQDITHYLAKGNVYFRTGERSKLEIQFAFQENQRKEYDSHGKKDKPSLSFTLQTLNAKINWDHSFHKNLKGSLGISGMYQTNRWGGSFFIPNFRNVIAGVYWYENLKLGNWDLEAGVRYDINHLQAFYYDTPGGEILSPSFLYNNVAANIGAVYHVNDNISLRLNYGLAWRPPHVSELFSDGLHHGSASYEVGNPNLVPERAHNGNISVNLNYSRFNLELTGFYYYIQDYIFLRPTLNYVLTIRGAFPEFAYNSGDVDIKGFDLDIEAFITPHLVLESKTSMLWAWNYTQNDYLIQMPPFRFDNDLKYNFNSGKWLKSPYLSFNSRVVTQQTMAPKNSDYRNPPDGYLLLGIGAGVELLIKQKQRIIVDLTVSNLLNASYRDYLDRFRYFADGMGRNITLNIKIPLEFTSYAKKL